MKVVKPFIKMKASSTETMQSMKKKKKDSDYNEQRVLHFFRIALLS